ncbi:MAG: PHB depolymerase family esterase [Verrucomicrobiota bacterium]|nr:PHB depolymerase family esterase [Verrucomicrobiota bacterium]
MRIKQVMRVAVLCLSWTVTGLVAQSGGPVEREASRAQPGRPGDVPAQVSPGKETDKPPAYPQEIEDAGVAAQTKRQAIRNWFSRTRRGDARGFTDREDPIHLPKNYDPSKPYPLILSLHAYLRSPRRHLKFFPLASLAEKYGFIYCVPEGVSRSWNATDACCDWRDKVDDSTYLRGIILRAMEAYHIDKTRVYVMGLSNGGFMSYRMAHDHSDLITAIVPFAGAGFEVWPSEPRHPVSVLHIHGTRDLTVRWKGGSILGSEYPGAEENFSRWRTFNRCFDKIEIGQARIDLDRKVAGEETRVQRYESKDGQTVTELWEVVGGRHVIPPRSVMRERIIQWMLSRSKPQ